MEKDTQDEWSIPQGPGPLTDWAKENAKLFQDMFKDTPVQKQLMIYSGTEGKEMLKKVLNETYLHFIKPNFIKQVNPGLYQITVGDTSMLTGEGGVKMFEEALKEQLKKYEK